MAEGAAPGDLEASLGRQDDRNSPRDPAGGGAAIELAELGRAYGERAVLRDVSLTVARGATLAVFGANGSGKTTLLRILATLLRPNAGTVRVLGAELPRRAHEVRGRLGLLAHDPLLYRDLTPRENLLYHQRLHGLAPESVDRALDAVALSARADEPVRLLSRGMTQRAAVARATLHAPELLLLDEPRANLDPAAAERLEPLIGRASGATRVLVSHDVEQGLAEADLVLGLRGARATLVAPAADVTAADLRELYR